MRLNAPNVSFKPDPQMSADALKRVTQKADNEKTINPERAEANQDANGLSAKLKTASTAMDTAATVIPHPKAKIALMAGAVACSAASTIAEKFENWNKGPGVDDSLKEKAKLADAESNGGGLASETIDMEAFTENSAIGVSELSEGERLQAQAQQAHLIDIGIHPGAVQQMGLDQLTHASAIAQEAVNAEPWVGVAQDSDRPDNMDHLMTAADVAASVPAGAQGMDPETLADLRNSAERSAHMGPDLA